MNNVSITGRLTRDAELIDLNNSTRKGIKFTLAVDRSRKNSAGEKEADFIPVVYFTEHWEKLHSCLIKGILISVTGKLSVHSYADSNTNQKFYTNVEAHNIEFLERKKEAAI